MEILAFFKERTIGLFVGSLESLHYASVGLETAFPQLVQVVNHVVVGLKATNPSLKRALLFLFENICNDISPTAHQCGLISDWLCITQVHTTLGYN